VSKDSGYSVTLTQAGKAITAHLDRADSSMSKAADHLDSATYTIQTAREECKDTKVSFTKWLKDMGIGKTRAYELLQIVDGKCTRDELLAKKAGAMRKYQARLKEKAAKSEASTSSEPETEPEADPKLDIADLIDFVMEAVKQKNGREIIANELAAICVEFGINH
tara:strand:+ start:2002 stop:2496 length:495 start_codon:yes stop_codon:yes gene_type:complete